VVEEGEVEGNALADDGAVGDELAQLRCDRGETRRRFELLRPDAGEALDLVGRQLVRPDETVELALDAVEPEGDSRHLDDLVLLRVEARRFQVESDVAAGDAHAGPSMRTDGRIVDGVVTSNK
jgi:hypothetical protein